MPPRRENHDDVDASSRRSLVCNSFTMKFPRLGVCFDCRAGAQRVMRHGLRRGRQSSISRAPDAPLGIGFVRRGKVNVDVEYVRQKVSGKELGTKHDNFDDLRICIACGAYPREIIFLYLSARPGHFHCETNRRLSPRVMRAALAVQRDLFRIELGNLRAKVSVRAEAK